MAAYENAIQENLLGLFQSEKRWGMRAACGSAVNGDYFDAYRRLSESLEQAPEGDSWQRGVALIDLRNYALLKGDKGSYYKEQEKLDELKSTVIFPDGEHYQYLANDKLRSIEAWKRSLSVNGGGFNGGHKTAIEYIENAFFSAVIYGSYSLMYSARKSMTDTLLSLSKLYEDPALAYHALRLYFIYGDEKAVRNIFRCDWPLVANMVSGHADKLWEAAFKCGGIEPAKIRCACVDLLASYFTELPMPNIRDFLLDRSVMREVPKQWAQALKSISMRLDSSVLVDILVTVINDRDSFAILA